MEITIRAYRPADRPALVRLLETLQDYQAGRDPQRRLRRLPEYGELYTAETLEKVKKSGGIIYLAEAGGEVLGCIVGLVQEATPVMRAAIDWTRAGYIDDLVVKDGWRDKGVGSLLLAKLEDFFRAQGCQAAGMDVLIANAGAHDFYARRGYTERLTYMTRSL
ncbi:MAG: GNAT family N-acetyltransferase [Dehalococcoidales bacterium]|jgi:ribosomal protein S18 acetylase RimI-like enzyme